MTIHDLTNDIRYVKGIGPKRAEIFNKLGVLTVKDLLCYFPRRYEDRRHFKTMDSVRNDEYVTVRGTVIDIAARTVKKMMLVEALISDSTASIKAVWFNQPYLLRTIEKGVTIVMSGKTEYYRGLQIRAPEYEILNDPDDDTIHTNRITPLYPLTEGLYQKSVRKVMYQLMVNDWHAGLTDYLPAPIRERYRFPGINETLRAIHFPDEFDMLERARARIVYEEFLFFEIAVVTRFKTNELYANHFPVRDTDGCKNGFTARLPFRLTDDQLRVIDDIFSDLSSAHAMNRLLQGDVGAGKTVVASAALYAMVKNGFQGAFLVPTEILAEQHYRTVRAFLEPYGIRTGILTGSATKAERKNILAAVAQGDVDILIGTHALLEERVVFRSLGLVVIDEQHKFGVMQRAQLIQQRERPHLLVMTATPIPRTLGLTLYGDLTISAIRSLPKGRKEIKTYWIDEAKRNDLYTFLKKKVAAGEQVYILFPLVEETEKSDLKAAVAEYERLCDTVFPAGRVGLVHGRLKKEEKDAAMNRFISGETAVLVTTTVVEVGIDNPNATCMVIEHAERFGLSQLHQLRGRVGRGTAESFCFLLGKPKTEEGKKRLEIMTRTHDGFLIAEEDLRLRGPGDFLGTRQSGLPQFLLANIVDDQEILVAARDDAFLCIKDGTAAQLCDTIFFTRKNSIVHSS